MKSSVEIQGTIRHERADEVLVAETRAGDDLSFAVLFERYHERIENFVFLRVGDRATAEDVTQEIFVAALRAIHSGHQHIVFKPWIYEIARNACIDQHRRAARAAAVVPLSDELAQRAPALRGEPQRELESQERFTEVRTAIRELPQAQRVLLVLREFGGLSYTELAERTGTTVGAVETALHRARRALSLRLGVRPQRAARAGHAKAA